MIKRVLSLLVLAALCAGTAAAQQNNIGSCGWGSKLFDGQKGVFPQVLGATTNGTFGNQTFGISSGTSGCTQDGAVKTTWKAAMFIDANKTKLARDMAQGQGETLASLASVMNVEEGDRAAFYAASHDGFSQVFAHEGVTTPEIVNALNGVLAQDAKLAKYVVMS